MAYDIAALKQVAAAQGARTELEALSFPEAGLEIVLRAPTPREFNVYFDTVIEDGREQDGRINLLQRCALYPSRGELLTAADRYALLAVEVCSALEEMAGSGTARSIVLAKDTPPEDLEPYGLTIESVRDLVDRYNQRGQLRAVACGESRVVIKRPSSFNIGQIQHAARTNKGYAQACINAAVDSIVWPDEGAVGQLLDRWPAFAGLVLAPLLMQHASVGAQGARKKL